jgi:hypothetical protein
VQLKRRHDLVPDLVATVTGYAAHERGALERVTELRTQAVALRSPSRLGEVESGGDTPVPNSTELHHTQANIHHAAGQKIRGLSSPECVGVR